MSIEKIERVELEQLARAKRLGYDGYCTDFENVTYLHNGRCGCGSGRVIIVARVLSEREGQDG
jgi:hypothetical protein